MRVTTIIDPRTGSECYVGVFDLGPLNLCCRGSDMTCKSCQSRKLRYFTAEINIHFPAFEGLTKPTVWVFPRLSACLNCGFTEFSIPKTELVRLAEESPSARSETRT